MKKIKVRRLSQLKNRHGSFAYGIVDAMGLDLDLFAGIYTNEETGEKILYSPNLIGEYEATIAVGYTLRTVGQRTFMNLTSVVPKWAEQVQQNMGLADRLGFGDAFKVQVAQQLAGSINFGGRKAAQAVQAAPQVEASTEETINEEIDADLS